MPNNFQRLIPLLIYRDIEAAHNFLVRAFGFASGGLVRDPQGHVVHGEVRAGDAIIWLHRVDADHALESPDRVNMAGAGLVVHVADVDGHWARAQAAGAQITYPPADQPYGQREYEARDTEGHRWWFATPTASLSSALQ